MERRTPWNVARLFVILLLVVVMVSLMGTVAFAQETDSGAEKECYLTGDMNADGQFDYDDPIHTLYHTIFADEYPIKQNADVNDDGNVDIDDAIELLYATIWNNPKYDKIAHDYYDPVWSWKETADGVTATVMLQCACGEGSHTLDAEVTAGATVAATCTAAGSEEYVATVSDHDETFSATYTKVIPAANHEEGEAAFDEYQHYTLCALCGEKLNAVSHSWTAGEYEDATCKKSAIQHYTCTCGAAKSELLGVAEHDFEYTKDVLVEGCQYAKENVCTVCGEVKLTDHYDNHNYVASIKEATCKENGQKVYTCSVCGDVDDAKTEIITAGDDKHIWNDGEQVGNVITYTCEICAQTKTSVVASDNGTVSNDALQNADELEIGDATLSMDDEMKDSLDKDIQISVAPAEQEKLDKLLNDEQKEQIKGNTVYDFNMSYADGGEVGEDGKFTGNITISLPYELQDGDDIDAIDVWYIATDGTLVRQDATYSNGYVTFTTNHFSYYTVTRLTPKERCARYGHMWTDASKLATCTSDGYTKEVCQRCAAEQNYEEKKAFNHSYTETVKAPTCEEFGSTVKVCDNCGHTTSSVTPALGHKLQLSETVDATCDAEGKQVYICANGCGHTAERAIAQLTHEYECSETVDATCTVGGYEIHVCKHCGDEIKKNETTPIGHKYDAEKATWTWNKKYTAANLTLICDNGCGVTKELKATVAVVDATCVTEGSVKAVVFYNNKPYTDEKVTASALGHKPSEEWIVTEKQHYYECMNPDCDEKLEVATHDYGDGVVTKDPTCTAAGEKTYTCAVCGCTKQEVIAPTGKHSYDNGVVTKEATCATKGTKLYTCAACGETKEEPIAATGDHNYVDGICSACGREQSPCRHFKMTTTLLDLSGFDICEGAEIYEIACECGEYRYLEINNIACDMVEVSQEEEDYKYSYTYECSKCGLHAVRGQMLQFSTEPCRAEMLYWMELTMDGKTVAEFYQVVESRDHYPHIKSNETKVSGETMCDLYAMNVSCDCGKNTRTQVVTSCEWEYMGEYMRCSVCGAKRLDAYQEPVVDGCEIIESTKYTFVDKNGTEVYTYTNEYTYYNHDNQVQSYELYGESCEDGVWIEYVCTRCGEITERGRTGSHPMVETVVTDLSEAKICASAHIQSVCACGSEKEEQLVYGNQQCQWAYVEAPNGGAYIMMGKSQCSVCGATRTWEEEESEKDANCRYTVATTVTYGDADGNLLVTGEQQRIYTQHNMETKYEFEGESCEDGVTVIERCVDCGMEDSWYREEHYVDRKEYNLSEFGYCGGYVYEYSCPCGEEKWAEIETWNCNWTGAGDEGWWYRECLECGGIWETYYEYKQLDTCNGQWDYSHSFRKDGEEFLKIEYSSIEDQHRWVYELTLNGETCDDGYTMKRSCLTCLETEELQGYYGGCETYPINREMITDSGLCGDVELITYSCACGANTHTEVNWIDGECNFVHRGPGEEEDSYVYVCTTCGVIRYERNYHEQMPGGSECEYLHRWEYTYILNDKELFVEIGNGSYTQHEWKYEYELHGESCEDGVTYRRICAKCGIQRGGDTVYYHVGQEMQYDLSEYGFCGGYAEIMTCACGQNGYGRIEPYACNWNNEIDEEGHTKHVCESCGGVWEVWYNEQPIDACTSSASFVHSFKQGEQELKLEWSERHYNHEYEYTYNLWGESCEDGVTVTTECTRCGEIDEYYTDSHEVQQKAYYNLADYGMCDGYFRVYVCPCGECQEANWYSDCTWFGKGGYGDPDGMTDYCENCGMVWSWTWKTVEQINSCKTRVQNTMTFTKGEVTIADTWTETEENHNRVYKLSLWEGSESCETGYNVEVYCQDCGENLDNYGSSGAHHTYVVATQQVELDVAYCGGLVQKTLSCACGEKTGVEYTFTQCQFEYQYDEERGDVYRCINCGIEQNTEYERVLIEGETCKYVYTETTTYVLNGNVILTYSSTSIEDRHNSVATYEMMGQTCVDGYIVHWSCTDCGMDMGQSGMRYGCETNRTVYNKLASKGELCGDLYLYVYSCACGANSHSSTIWDNGSCNFGPGRWDGELRAWIYTCSDCQAERYYTETREYIEGTACEYLVTETSVYKRNGAELFSYSRDYKVVDHNDIAKLTLQVEGGTCDDGYTVEWFCQDCGAADGEVSEVLYGCCTYTVKKEKLGSKGDLCGDLYRYTSTCACGKENDIYRSWNYDNCNFTYVGYNEEEQCENYLCEKCGATYKRTTQSELVDGNVCTQKTTWSEDYYNADGKYLFTNSWDNVSHSGTWVYTYYLNGKTCSDGYTYTATCAHCGKVEESEYTQYGCNAQRVEYIPIVADSEEVCGAISMSVYDCACGNNKYWEISYPCWFYWIEGDGKGTETYQCNNCGLKYSSYVTSTRELNSCLVLENVKYQYWMEDGEQTISMGSIDKTISKRAHEYVYKMTLVDGATSCDDGYYLSSHCAYCDHSISDNSVHNGHYSRRTEYYNFEDYGMCGGYAAAYSCACGKEKNWQYQTYSCNYESTGEENEYGVSERYCTDCNTYFYITNTGKLHRAECASKYTMYARIVRDDEVLLDLVKPYQKESHTMVAIGFDGTCGEAQTVYYQCHYCGKQETNKNHSGHVNALVEYLDLELAGACGGYVEKRACQCGYYSSITWYDYCSYSYGEWTEEEIDGVIHRSRARTCNNCGLVIYETRYEQETEESCKYERVCAYAFYMDDKLLKIFEDRDIYTSHDYQLTDRTLLGESCEDGVKLTYTCKCGESYTDTEYYHEQYLDEDQNIDLSQYGSVCGCELQYYVCTCGDHAYYYISGNCDLDSRYMSDWVEGAIDTSQPGLYGWNYIDSYGYKYACAVTDPQCGLKYRMGYFWLAGDNCTAVKYQVWQLGLKEVYDEDTGAVTYTWEKEIRIPTGEVCTYHDYEYTTTDTVVDGEGTTTESYVCKACGSSYYQQRDYSDGSWCYYERTFINKLDNGEAKYWSDVEERNFLYNGGRYTTLERESHTYADGTEYWWQREITYGTKDACTYRTVYTNSDGDNYVQSEGEHYFGYSSWDWVEYPTCTQPGIRVYREHCGICEELLYENYEVAQPNGHYWRWSSELQHYYCNTCGLEGVNGADGTIIVEDLTDDYGNGENYVVGYWNWSDGDFTVYASVILDEAEDDNNEIVLEGIEFNFLNPGEHDINAVTTNSAALQEAASAAIAEAGYTGSYAIRIAFVPADDEGMLDYAITFDSQMA